MQQNAILEGFRKLVRGTVRRVGGNLSSEDREDVEQQAMLELYIHLQKTMKSNVDAPISDQEHAGLANQIAKYRAVDAIRKKQNPAQSAITGLMGPQQESELSLDAILVESVTTGVAPSPVDAALQRDMLDYLRCRLNTRELLLLDLVGRGYTDSEIAAYYDLPTATVKSRIQDWKKKCRRVLSQYDTSFAALQKRRGVPGEQQKTEQQKTEDQPYGQ